MRTARRHAAVGGAILLAVVVSSVSMSAAADGKLPPLRLVGRPVFLYVIQTKPVPDRFYYITVKFNRPIPHLSRATGTAATINGVAARLEGPGPPGSLCYSAFFEQQLGGAGGKKQSLGVLHVGRTYTVSFRLHTQAPFSAVVRLQNASPGSTNPFTGTKIDPKLAPLCLTT